MQVNRKRVARSVTAGRTTCRIRNLCMHIMHIDIKYPREFQSPKVLSLFLFLRHAMWVFHLLGYLFIFRLVELNWKGGRGAGGK